MGLNPNQEKVRTYGKGNLLVEAGPGSGKTTVIVERIKYLIENNVPPESFLVITFTRKAAENLQIKLKKDLKKSVVEKMQISTIHSFCFEFLKNKNKILNLLDDDSEERKRLFVQKYREKLGFKGIYTLKNHQIPSIVDKFQEYTNFHVDSENLIKYLEDEMEINPKFYEFVNENKYFSNRKVKDEGFKEDWYNARYQQVARAYQKYLALLDENSLVDYNTLQLKTLEELELNPETQYKTILIDEFQDTDPLQFEIFKILQKNADYFTVVGDIDQRIYSFRSTFKDYFDELECEPNTTRISLNCNYRSTNNIVDLTDKFICHQRSKNSLKELKANNQEYDNPSFILETEMSKNRKLRDESYDQEAQKIFDIIVNLKENNQAGYEDIAVLYRKHSSKTIGYLVDKFNEAKIPISIKGRSDLKDKKEVKTIIIMLWYITRKLDDSYITSNEEFDWLSLKGFCIEELEGVFWHLADETKRYLSNLHETFVDEVTKIRNIECPSKNGKPKVITTIGNEKEEDLIKIFKQVKKPIVDINKIVDDEDRQFFEKLENLRENVLSDNPPEILKVYYTLLSWCNYFEDVDKKLDEVSNLATLTQTMSNYEEYISPTDLRGLYFFLTQVIRGYGANYEKDKAVQLMTVHAAKGLEFPVTIVASLQKDEFPMKVKDEKRQRNNIDFKDTFYTPNEYLKYKYFIDEEGVYRPITIEEENNNEIEEEERVIYVAMTRAADLLILSCLGEVPQRIENIREYLKPFTFEDLENVKINKHFDNTPQKEPIILNYSKYTKFLSCSFKFNLGYNLGFSRPGSIKAANRGTVFHEIMETVNLKLKEGLIVSCDELSQITRDAYKSMFDIEENQDEFEEFKSNVINYYKKYSLNRDVLEAELDFEIDNDKYILNGAIDLIYKVSDNEIVILDYKYAEYDKNHIDGYTKQLYLYAFALKQLDEFKDYTIKKAITHFVLKDYQHIVEIDENVLDDELEMLNIVADRIDKNNFIKDPKNSKDCEKCSYRIFCKPKEFAGELYE